MIKTTGSTGIAGFINRNPSMDEVTVIDGVITPSASRAPPPIIVRTAAHEDFFFIKANSAKIPPSPWLSALKVINTYLKVVCKVSVQKTHERAP